MSADRSPTQTWAAALELVAKATRDPHRTLPVIIEDQAKLDPDRPALVMGARTLSYQALAELANRVARFALEQGIKPGDRVALMLPNQVDYMGLWLGLTRVGAIVALINCNLRAAGLAHAIEIVEPSHLIVGHAHVDAVQAARSLMTLMPKVWQYGGDPSTHDIPLADDHLRLLPGSPLKPHEPPPVTLSDIALYIYTSGTTGAPKAAAISHRRIVTWSHWHAGMMHAGSQDRLYDCLPLYHSIGGVAAPGAMLASGGTVVLAEKFSASHFWRDIVGLECTVFQYIGELCRYLVGAEASPSEAQHRELLSQSRGLRLAIGNGMSAPVWKQFQARFNVPEIIEFYAATEGNFSLYNIEGKVGSIGRVPAFLAHRFGASLIKFDVEAGLALRDATGRCLRCEAGETGLAIGKIATSAGGAGGSFEGYRRAKDTDAKVLRDVFAPGDAWFSTGDLMQRDAQGFFTFVDRVGDTFRWKGENVATLDVAAVVAQCPGVADANVYGVNVPGCEGRAGMVALVTGPDFDPKSLYATLTRGLPDYARPLFFRLQSNLAVTDTFKLKKAELVALGFDPNKSPEPLLFRDSKRQALVPLDADLYAAIVGGQVRI